MRTAIMIPTYNHSILFKDCLRRLALLDPQPTYYIIFENNSVDDTWSLLKEWKRNHPNTIFIRMWFTPDAIKKLGNPYEIIGLARDYLLKKARQLNVDYAIFVDDDIIILNESFIDQITGREKDIVGAPYMRFFPDKDGKPIFALASKWKVGEKKYKFKVDCKGFQEVWVTSCGCICLSRKVIQDERLSFLPIIWNKEKRASEDFGFCMKARELGYKIHIDCMLKVGHYATAYSYKPWAVEGKDKDGNLLPVEFEYGKEHIIEGEIKQKL